VPPDKRANAQPPQPLARHPPAEASGAVVAKAITADVATDAMLLNADGDQNNWLPYGRTYDNQRFRCSPRSIPAMLNAWRQLDHPDWHRHQF
jgi:hypothetical protein